MFPFLSPFHVLISTLKVFAGNPSPDPDDAVRTSNTHDFSTATRPRRDRYDPPMIDPQLIDALTHKFVVS